MNIKNNPTLSSANCPYEHSIAECQNCGWVPHNSVLQALGEIQSLKDKLDKTDEELDWWKAHKRRGRSGCACNIEEDGETITEWCAVHAEYKNKLAVVEGTLEEITKGEGEFNRDRLTHASNCIDSMKAIANKALATIRGDDKG